MEDIDQPHRNEMIDTADSVQEGFSHAGTLQSETRVCTYAA